MQSAWKTFRKFGIFIPLHLCKLCWRFCSQEVCSMHIWDKLNIYGFRKRARQNIYLYYQVQSFNVYPYKADQMKPGPIRKEIDCNSKIWSSVSQFIGLIFYSDLHSISNTVFQSTKVSRRVNFFNAILVHFWWQIVNSDTTFFSWIFYAEYFCE